MVSLARPEEHLIGWRMAVPHVETVVVGKEWLGRDSCMSIGDQNVETFTTSGHLEGQVSEDMGFYHSFFETCSILYLFDTLKEFFPA